ncbi:MAG: hypothetical protein KH202_06105 [Clostridiales bacterium]|nr:hypothetical protein [Clostridiales bacterium]
MKLLAGCPAPVGLPDRKTHLRNAAPGGMAGGAPTRIDSGGRRFLVENLR